MQKRSLPLVERDRVAGLRGTDQLSVSLRLLSSEEDLELLSAQLHSAITSLMFLMFMVIYLHNMQVEFLYVCCDFGAPCDYHRLWPVRRSILRFLCRHALLLQTVVYVKVDTKRCASYGFAFVNDQAEQFQRCSFQYARTCSPDLAGSEGFERHESRHTKPLLDPVVFHVWSRRVRVGFRPTSTCVSCPSASPRTAGTSTSCTTSSRRRMCSDVSSLSDWICSSSLFDRSLERPRVDADVVAPKQDGSAPLLIAALRDQRDTVKSLCGSRTGANKANQVGVTPLMTDVLQRLEDMMATCDHLEELVLFLQVGHNVTVTAPGRLCNLDCANGHHSLFSFTNHVPVQRDLM